VSYTDHVAHTAALVQALNLLLLAVLLWLLIGCAKPAPQKPMCIAPDIQVNDACVPPWLAMDKR
jgi:hypothetical protein